MRINLVCIVGYRYCVVYIPGCPHLKAECFYKVEVCIDWLSALMRCPYESCVHSNRISVFTQGLNKRGVCRRSISTLIYNANVVVVFGLLCSRISSLIRNFFISVRITGVSVFNDSPVLRQFMHFIVLLTLR